MKNYTAFIEKTAIFTLGVLVASFVFIYLFSDLWKYRALDQTIKQASAHEYDVIDYNCVDFSNSAVSLLKNQNIEANTVVIKSADSTGTHAVVSVFIDPQTGQFVTNASYLGNYNDLQNQYGWAR